MAKPARLEAASTSSAHGRGQDGSNVGRAGFNIGFWTENLYFVRRTVYHPVVLTLRDLDRRFSLTPAAIGRQLSHIDVARGRQEAFRLQNPTVLDTLIAIARVQSVESSNAIENVTAPHKRILELVAEKTTPRNRSEAEIAGYRAVLDLIHASAQDIPFRPPIVEQLHRDLYQFTGIRAGRWKNTDNEIAEEHPDGSRTLRFEPLGALETPEAMRELHELFGRARDASHYHDLILVGSYALDFLCIHPFSDGNGRMSRLLTLLLLYQADYEVGRFISLEKLIEDTKESYYDALHASSQGWHQGVHDPWPWLSYFLGTIVAAYRDFEARASALTGGRGSKQRAIEEFVRSTISDEFDVDDVRRAVPGASDVYIREQLRALKKRGVLDQRGRGSNAVWVRLRSHL